jgi:hypothetical protein
VTATELPLRAVSVIAVEAGAGRLTEVTSPRAAKEAMASRFAELTVRPRASSLWPQPPTASATGATTRPSGPSTDSGTSVRSPPVMRA